MAFIKPISTEKAAQAAASRQRIADAITAATGVTGIPGPEDTLRFGGSAAHPLLVLCVFVVQSDGKEWLYADLDDEISWHEWDFPAVEALEEQVVATVVPMVDQVVKTVRETKRFQHLKIATYRQTDGGWELIEEDVCRHPLIKLFLWKNRITETVTDYRLR